MIAVDTSAIVALFLGEPEAGLMRDVMRAAEDAKMSAANVAECQIVLDNRTGDDNGELLRAMLFELGVAIEPRDRSRCLGGRECVSALRQGPPQGAPELRRLLRLRAGQEPRRAAAVQGRRLPPYRRQGRASSRPGSAARADRQPRRRVPRRDDRLAAPPARAAGAGVRGARDGGLRGREARELRLRRGPYRRRPHRRGRR